MGQILALFSDYTVAVVGLGGVMLGCISGVLGSFSVLKHQSLLGDGVSHAALPGVVLAFLITGRRSTEILLLGALVTGLIATGLILAIVRRSRVKFDSALALVMSVFFGLGLVLLTYAQKQPGANQAGLNRFIYGQASTMLKSDLWLIGICGALLIGLVLVFWKEFKLICFDPQFAQVAGLPTGRLNILLSGMIVVAIILGLQTVGVVLMSAMMIAPAVAARQWTGRLHVMVPLAALFGGLSGLAGTLWSSLVPGMPTGPAIVVAISAIACLSLLIAPGRGVLYRIWHRRRTAVVLTEGRG